ncbi:MAG: hypothetical protein AAB795_00805 [Patescibacteria group bacterium]
MKKFNLFPVILSASSLIATFPLAALALPGEDAFDVISFLVNGAIFALIGIATIIFMYGVIQYVIAKGDEKQLASGKTYMLYGIIGLVVMVTVWGFVNIIINTIFGVNSSSEFAGPRVSPLGTSRSVDRTNVICLFGVWCF